MTKLIKTISSVALVVSSVFLASGCATAKVEVPNTALSTAKEALLKAQQPDIVKVAPLDMRIAQERLEMAQDAYRNGDYAAADRFAQETLLNVQIAESKTLKAKVLNAKNDLHDTVNVLKKEISRN